MSMFTGQARRRLDRTKGKKFGDADYALEELVAELGAAMFCARVGLTSTPRADHAQYLAHWCASLKAEPRVLWSTASSSSAAVDMLAELAGGLEPRAEELAGAAA
jgi:antirestriction protein ArdC